MTSVWQDFLYGCRMLRQRPGFTFIAAVSLALGIGANTVIFSLINGLLLRPMNYPESDRLMWIWSTPVNNPGGQGSMFAPNFFAFRDQNQSFASVGGTWGGVTANLGASENGTPPEKILGEHLTPGMFRTLGVQPILGRTFTDEENQVNKTANVLVLSYAFWQRRFQGSKDAGGRDFTDRDTASAPPVVIINDAMAKKFWPNETALGKFIKVDYVPDEPLRQIVGIVSNVRQFWQQREPQSIMYLPHLQQTPRWMGPGWALRAGMYFILRTPGNPMALVPSMRSALAEVEPNRPAGEIRTVTDYLDRQVQYDRLYMMLLVIFGAVAAVLAAIGIYGVMSYAVAERTREIGIRMALGASSAQVFKMVVRRALVLVGIGLTLGLGGAYGLTRLIASQLYEVKANDPLTFVAVAGGMALVAVLACVIPTRRAVNVEPTVALRHE